MSRTPNHQRMLSNLTDFVTGCRPDWSPGETRRILDNAYRDRHALLMIGAAAIDAALNGTAQPETITAHLANGWGSVTRGWTKSAIDEARNPLPHGQAYPRCGRCKLELLAGETRDNHVCADLIDRDGAKITAAKQAMREALAAVNGDAT